jgi:hypothetical protein
VLAQTSAERPTSLDFSSLASFSQKSDGKFDAKLIRPSAHIAAIAAIIFNRRGSDTDLRTIALVSDSQMTALCPRAPRVELVVTA